MTSVPTIIASLTGAGVPTVVPIACVVLAGLEVPSHGRDISVPTIIASLASAGVAVESLITAAVLAGVPGTFMVV